MSDTVDKNRELPFEIQVRIAPDYLSASVSVRQLDSSAVLKPSDIEAALLKKNVSYGIDKYAISKICENPGFVDDVIVARGTPYAHGEDGKITYKFNTDSQSKPKILADGSVDFKNMNFLIPVKKGETLAKRSMPTLGTVGTLVTGKIMKGKDGKIVNFKLGKNVSLSENGLKVIADDDGSIKFDNGVISVQKKLEISGDVGVETGNISFSGKVLIGGNVLSGYSVYSSDDVVVNGLVEGAVIETAGSLVINNGVQGGDAAKLKVGGDLTAKFISSSQVECGGNIEVDAITHSKIYCLGHVKSYGKRGMIIGGEIYAAKGITAKQLGSDMCTSTGLYAGIDAENTDKFIAMQEEREEILVSINKIEQLITLLKQQGAGGTDNQEMMEKTLKSKEEYVSLLADVEHRLGEFSIYLEEMKKAKICASDIYPGIRIRLGNSYYSVKDKTSDTMFFREGVEIQLKPWYLE